MRCCIDIEPDDENEYIDYMTRSKYTHSPKSLRKNGGPYNSLSLERAGAARNKGRLGLPNAVWEWELDSRDEELLDIGTTNIVRLFELDDTENLFITRVIPRTPGTSNRIRT